MKLNLRVTYPDDAEYETKLVRINLDKEKEEDFKKGKGFDIKEPPPLNKALKRTDSIYSEKFMKTLQDPDAYSDRYSCKCGKRQGRDWKDMICPYCRTKVEYVGDDFEMFGWINIKEPYCIIHPNLYKSIGQYIGMSTLEAILMPDVDLDENGNPIGRIDATLAKKKAKRRYSKAKIDETYAGLGMMGFHDKFNEIMEYFHQKNKQKKIDYYNDIMNNKDMIFIHNIPVYSTALRPYKVEGKRFTFEGTNAIFTMLSKGAAKVNDDSLTLYRIPKYRNSALWDLQERYNNLYDEVEKICANKKGVIRSLVGGRCSFTSRSVIVPDPTLQVDQVRLSYFSLLELLQQTIINILVKTYNIGEAEAAMRFSRARITPDPRIKEIIQNLIDTKGINVLVNRNPTINYGSIMAMRVCGINDDYVMSMPLQVLPSFAADSSESLYMVTCA